MEIFLYVMLYVFLCIIANLIVTWLLKRGIYKIFSTSRILVEKEIDIIKYNDVPSIHSSAFLDKFELFLIHSGVRKWIPFLSSRVCVILMTAWIIIAINVGLLLHQSMLNVIGISVSFLLSIYVILSFYRQRNLLKTENSLLELINLAESFSATEDEIISVLGHCARYTRNPLSSILNYAKKESEQGVSTRLVLEKLKVQLEHPKWQEFIHNLSICSMYNSDYQYVFHASRNNMQSYLTSKKERDGVRRAAKVEMGILFVMGVLIMYMMGKLLNISMVWLLKDTMVGQVISGYFIVMIAAFSWKILGFEKE